MSIVIRLDAETRAKLGELAHKHNIPPATAAAAATLAVLVESGEIGPLDVPEVAERIKVSLPADVLELLRTKKSAGAFIRDAIKATEGL